jgi:hypothetical protein
MMQSVLLGFGRLLFAQACSQKPASALPDHVPKAALFSLIRLAAAISKTPKSRVAPQPSSGSLTPRLLNAF